MSLFGTSPEESSGPGSSQQRPSLFSDEPSVSSRLFADDDVGSSSKALWSNSPTTSSNRGTTRQDLIKNLLSETDVPESYIDAYDSVLNAGSTVGSGISLTAVREVLAGSGINATDQTNILNLVASGDGIDDAMGNGFGRAEFNVLLTLVGLAQEGEDVTLDSVDERRNSRIDSSAFDFRLLAHGMDFADMLFLRTTGT